MKKCFSILLSTLIISTIPIFASSCSITNSKQENITPPTDGGDSSGNQDSKPSVNPNPPVKPDPQPPVDPNPPIEPEPNPPDTGELSIDEQIYNAINLIPAGGTYNHKEIYTKDFAKFINLDYKGKDKNYNNYLIVNQEELNKKFGDVMKDYDNFLVTFSEYENKRFDFNNPSSLKFQVSFNKKGTKTKKTVIVNDFKINPDWWGALDREPIKVLTTPSGCTSYKGKLEKFKFTDIQVTSENNYVDLLRKTTNEDIKLNFMYQVRFGIYQMFSDNFSEINYYIKNETSSGFIAVAEGIIKNDKNNFKWAIQPHNGTGGFYGTTSVKTGDRVIYQIESYNNFSKPTLISNDVGWGDFTHSWHWDFSDNCENLRDPNNPLFVNDKLFRDSWSRVKNVQIKLAINNQDIFSYPQGIAQWNFYNFVLKRKSS